MASEVPQIDLGSLSTQQLQHLLATSRHAGRTSMADAATHELRERRSQPSAARSWMSVDFGDPAPETAEVSPRGAAPSEHLAAPYNFNSLRTIPDESELGAKTTPWTPSAKANAARPRRGAQTPKRRGGRARLAAAVGGGAMALASAAVVVTLEWRRAPSSAAPPAARVALKDPGGAVGRVLPRASVALVLPLRGPIAGPADAVWHEQEPAGGAKGPASAPSQGGEFSIAAADLQAAANQADMAKAQAEGLQGIWLSPDWAPARCRWSPGDPSLAVCRTRTRYGSSGPWHESTGSYRRDQNGDWQVGP